MKKTRSIVPELVSLCLRRRFLEQLLTYPPAVVSKMVRSGWPGNLASVGDRSMSAFTPKTLCDAYIQLTPMERNEFLHLLGKISVAEVPWVIVSEFNELEAKRFSDIMFSEIYWRFYPSLEREARQMARANPGMSDEEFEKKFHEHIKEQKEHYDHELSALATAQLKASRDRKSDPEIILRNVKICDLRKQDKRKWSQGRLAKEFHVTARAIRKILHEEQKWRRMEAQLRTK